MLLDMRSGVLLMQLGTPAGPGRREVGRFLGEFLCDGRVLDVPWIARWVLVHGIIVPTRAGRSAKAYGKIWDERGSPLLYHGMDLCDGVREELGADWPVELAMRYGQPSVGEAMEKLVAVGCERVVCAPLYPQEAKSTTESSRVAVEDWVRKSGRDVALAGLEAFHEDARYLDAVVACAEEALREFGAEEVLFSYHGLPERHVRKSNPGGVCLESADCCAALGDENRHCYRAQCFATTKELVARLGLEEGEYATSFQSRLGRSAWIGPHTDSWILECAGRGVRRVAVFCPAFVADCLETLEEIGMAARDSFRAAGGEDLFLVPALNARAEWSAALAEMLRDRLEEQP
jgi:ferrochelatase